MANDQVVQGLDTKFLTMLLCFFLKGRQNVF
jgi:hypothetical protein